MDIVNKHEVHEKSYRKLAAEYGVSGKWLIFENLKNFSKFFIQWKSHDSVLCHVISTHMICEIYHDIKYYLMTLKWLTNTWTFKNVTFWGPATPLKLNQSRLVTLNHYGWGPVRFNYDVLPQKDFGKISNLLPYIKSHSKLQQYILL